MSRLESQAKAHYFTRGEWLKGKRGVVIVGSGPSGRILARWLEGDKAASAQVVAFVDNRPGPPDRTVMGVPAAGFVQAPPLEFLGAYRDCFFALCVGEEQGRAMMTTQFAALGLQPGRDYLRFI